MYLVGYEKENASENARYFGNVQLNHRSIPSIYVEKDQKIVMMRDLNKT